MRTFLIAFIFCPLVSLSQDFHFSTKLGISGYQGDLQAKPVSFAGFLGSLGVRYDLTEHFSLRSYLTLTSLSADDKKGTTSMRDRNLNFKTKLFDFEAGIQYSLFDMNNVWWTPYAFAGVGLFHFNPFTNDADGNKTFLQPLSTEGQGFIDGKPNYKLTQFSIPMGIGAERMLNEDMRVGLEIGYRKIFTDYLDDVSDSYVDQNALLSARGQTAVDLAYRGDEIHVGSSYPAAGTNRGNPKNKDGYFYIGATFTVRFWFDKYKQIAGLPSSGKSKKVGCPATRY